MRKLIAYLITGYCGSDAHEAFTIDDDTSEAEINQMVYEMAIQNAESHGYYPYPEYDLDGDDDENDYTDSIEGYYEEYNPEKHDMYRAGGGSFEQDF